MSKKLLITIDTEADNQWDVSRGISTENTLYLPRFQELCERYGFIPTWLTNWEMCNDERFVQYMKPKNDAGLCEIGMHLHAWNNPPEFPLETVTDQRAYLIEYTESQMASKIDTLLDALQSNFEAPITSHRSGRWALDERYIALLAERGFVVDCSVTPHMSWEGALGQSGMPGSDYSMSDELPYELCPGLLEVPMTIRRTNRFALDAVHEPRDVLRQGKRLVMGQWQWLRPSMNPSASSLTSLLRDVSKKNDGYAMFMIHSSELMPGGSPNFPDESSIEKLYRVIDRTFAVAAKLGFEGQGMTAFAKDFFICRGGKAEGEQKGVRERACKVKKTIKPASCSSASILNNSRVLVIGGDHENTLASVRALGLAGIDFDLLIHSGKSCGKSSVFASKYAPVPIYAEGSYDSIHKAIKAWLGDSNPADCLLMPSSDLSALVIDERFRSLGVKTSGFLGDEWQICDLMDKHAQSQWAAARGILVAKGVEIDLAASGPHSPLALPVIIKPAVSAEGQKSDIRICRNPAEYADAVSAFSNAGYKRVLVQELIGYEYEVTCVGLIRLDGSLAWRAYAKEVVYPEGRGSIASGRLETDPSVLQVIHRVLSTLAEEGYRGLCDIEFFKTPDRVLLNEINFRQSGIVAFTFYEGLYLPSIWAKECLGLPSEFVCEYPEKSYRVIYETSYFRYMRDTGTSAFEWIKALREAGGKNLIFTGDNGPLRVFIWNTVTNKFRRLAGIKV